MPQLRPHDLQLQNVSVRFRAARADILYVVDLNAHAFDRAQQRAERHAALELHIYVHHPRRLHMGRIELVERNEHNIDEHAHHQRALIEARARGKAHARRGPQARGGRKAGDVALAGDEDAARAEEADAAHDLRRHTERIARHTEILCLIQARHHNGRRADAHKKMRAQSGGVLALAAGHADDAAAEKCDGKAHQHGDKIHFVQMLYNSVERCHTSHPFRIKVTKPETAYRFFVVIIVQYRKKCKNIFYKNFTRFFLIVKIHESSPVDPPPHPAFSAFF